MRFQLLTLFFLLGFISCEKLIQTNEIDSEIPDPIFEPVLSLISSSSIQSTGIEGSTFTPSQSTLQLKNSGGGTLAFQLLSDVSWIQLSPSSGTLSEGQTISISASLLSNSPNLLSGDHLGSISISCCPDQATIQVTWVVHVLNPQTSTAIFLAVGNGGSRITSLDGKNWSTDPLGIELQGDNSYSFRGCVIGGNTLIAVGGGTRDPAVNYDSRISSSLDGISWQQRTDLNGFFGGVAYGNGIFVAAGGGSRVARSVDGVTWTNSPRVPGSIQQLRDIVYGNNLFVTVGDNGKRAASSDGVTWTGVLIQGGDLGSIAFGNGKFVAIGKTRVTTSTDGMLWTDVTLSNANMTGMDTIIFTDTKFIISRGSRVFHSTDGISWTEHVAPQIYGMAYGAGLIVGGSSTGIYYSANGIQWTRASVPQPSPVQDFAFGYIFQ